MATLSNKYADWAEMADIDTDGPFSRAHLKLNLPPDELPRTLTELQTISQELQRQK